jgi:hypothetical protein
MKRLLLIGKKLPRLESISWDESLTHNILDYQGLLFDCRQMAGFSSGQVLSQRLLPYLNLRHPVYVIAPDLKAMDKPIVHLSLFPAPNFVSAERSVGRTIKLASSAPFYQEYFGCLQGHEVVIKPHFTAPPVLKTVVDNLQQMVCGEMTIWNVFLLHPPAKANEDRAFKIILEHFEPDFLEPEPEAAPTWAAPEIASIPGVKEIEQSVSGLKERVSGLENEIDQQLQRKADIEKWAELLWADGIPLQNRVREAFYFLGFKTESNDPTGHTQDLTLTHDGYTFFVEVTGSNGSIKIDKGRELMQWLIDAPSPEKVRGVLVANAFRNLPPTERPPTSNHKMFTTELEQLANRYDFALLDVKELYRVVFAKLENKAVDLNSVCRSMTGRGLIAIEISPGPTSGVGTSA